MGIFHKETLHLFMGLAEYKRQIYTTQGSARLQSCLQVTIQTLAFLRSNVNLLKSFCEGIYSTLQFQGNKNAISHCTVVKNAFSLMSPLPESNV